MELKLELNVKASSANSEVNSGGVEINENSSGRPMLSMTGNIYKVLLHHGDAIIRYNDQNLKRSANNFPKKFP